jgi:hypothetical protein
METPCIFCLNEVRYIIDFSLSVASPKKAASEQKTGMFASVGTAAG